MPSFLDSVQAYLKLTLLQKHIAESDVGSNVVRAQFFEHLEKKRGD